MCVVGVCMVNVLRWLWVCVVGVYVIELLWVCVVGVYGV